MNHGNAAITRTHDRNGKQSTDQTAVQWGSHNTNKIVEIKGDGINE